MSETTRNEFDYGEIRITPNVQDRINEMHRKRAEDRAARHQMIAIEAHRSMRKAQLEADRYRRANTELLGQVHAALGWPKRVLLPAPEVM